MESDCPVQRLVGLVVIACKLEALSRELEALHGDVRRFNAEVPDGFGLAMRRDITRPGGGGGLAGGAAGPREGGESGGPSGIDRVAKSLRDDTAQRRPN